MAATATAPTLVELDPKSLAEHPANIRFELGDLTELTASIKAVGVLEPVIVVPITDENKSSNDKKGKAYRILAGHRRVAAAVKAKSATVPCIVRDDLAGDVDALTTMIIENVMRADLSPVEEAAAYAQLAAFDLNPTQIAERTGRKTKAVRDGLKLNGLPEQVKQPVADGSITLAEAAAIAEFAEDEKAHARLLKAAADGWGLSYKIADERNRRKKAAAKAKHRETLTKAGVKIVGQPKSFPYGSREARVTALACADGTTAYTVETHRDCPGHATFLDNSTGEPVFICRDPDEHGHVRLLRTNHISPAEAERRAAEDAAYAEHVEALTVAAQVRREFIRDRVINQAKPAPQLIRAALAMLFAYIEDVRRGHVPLVAELLGLDGDTISVGKAYAARLDKTTEARLWQHTVAHAAALAEASIDACASRHRIGYRPLIVATWFDLLETCGYQPSEVEQAVRAEAEADRRLDNEDDDLAEEATAAADDGDDEDDTVNAEGDDEPDVDQQENSAEGSGANRDSEIAD
jgi:ParB family transcriptional regulator, chromosome partitioning protein